MSKLTMDEWRAMSERERDAVVAEKVMGWTYHKSKHGHWMVTDHHGDRHEDGFGAPRYDSLTGHKLDREWWDEVCDLPTCTSDISAAWEVVEKMRERGLSVTVTGYWQGSSGKWWAHAMDNVELAAEARADTAPEAIVLAALRAVGALK